VAEIRLRAMGSDCHVIVVGGADGLVERARRRIDELEGLWSRFRDDSEVSELNRRAGTPVVVSAETVELVERALEAWRISGGSFDPTLLGAVIRAGYDRTFDEIGASAGSGSSVLLSGADQIVVEGRAVTLPVGVGFDPGGIGKGLAADLVAAEILAAGATGVCVNMGGDVRVAGSGPDGGPWTVAVEHPWLTEPLALVGLTGGAVATSTTLKRRWQVGESTRHHLIDPQTGIPSDTDVNLAAVIAAQTWVAEVLAKAVVLRGSAYPFDNLGGTGAEGLAVADDGRVMATDGFPEFLGGVPLRPVVERPIP
jgi:thiamine biosynthesis lipoprotein